MEKTVIEEIKFIETSFVRITYNEENKLLMTEWLGTPSDEEYKKLFIDIMKIVDNRNLVIHLAYTDIRRQGIVSPENRRWYEKTVFPKLVSCGTKKGAVFLDANIFKRYYINAVFKAVNKFGIPLKVFNTKKGALDFLLKS